MTLQTGTIIRSTGLLNDTYFESATIVITKCNNDDTVGFVINKPFHQNLNNLKEFKSTVAFALFEGGPVDQQHLFFIHKRNDLIKGGNYINDNTYFGGDFTEVVNCINNNSITEQNIKIFVGYCGWDTPQLQEEFDEGSWTISNENVFTTGKGSSTTSKA